MWGNGNDVQRASYCGSRTAAACCSHHSRVWMHISGYPLTDGSSWLGETAAALGGSEEGWW